MLTLTYGNLRDPAFNAGLRRMGEIRALHNSTAYNIAKILKAVAAEAEIVEGLLDRLVDGFVEKDEFGKRVPAGGPGHIKVIDGKTDELNATLKEFYKTEIKIGRPKVKLEEVAKDLSPREILALESLWLPVVEVAE